MKPQEIMTVLDMAYSAMKRGKTFNPLLIGQAGLGKSEIAQQWVKEMRTTGRKFGKPLPNFGFMDLRLAYLEGPDFIGLPKVTEGKNVEFVTNHIIPAMWDKLGDCEEGLLLIEEPNRGTSSVLNCLMQMLTDNRVHELELPKGLLKCGVINPDSAGYDVNTLDTALRDRFVPYEIIYDHHSFVQFMKDNEWDQGLVAFIESGVWQYKAAEEITGDGKYIAPRTYNYLNNALQSGLRENPDFFMHTATAQLGKMVGREFYNFTFEQKPVTVEDILKDKEEAFKRLVKYSHPYRGDLISVTMNSIIDHTGTNPLVDVKFIAEVMCEIPADQANALMIGCTGKFSAVSGKEPPFAKDYVAAHPPLRERLKRLATPKVTK